MQFTPEGNYLVTGGRNTDINCYPYTCGQIKVWNIPDTSLMVSFGVFNMGLTNDLDISSDGQTIISGHGSVYCSAFSGCSRDRAGQFEFGINGGQFYSNTNPDGIIYSIAFSPDNSIIAAGTGYNNSGHINIYDSQYNLINTLTGHSSRTASILFTPDGEYLISGGYDGYIRVWNYLTGNIVTEFQHGIYTNGGVDVKLSLSPDGQYLASTGDGYHLAVKIWKTSDWSLVHTFTIESPYGATGTAKFTPNGLYLAAGYALIDPGPLGWYGVLRFYDPETGELVREYIDLHGNPANGGIISLAFSSSMNNHFAYCVGQGNQVRLRLAATNLELTNGTIPVELTSFIVDASENNVILNWITASETNNSGFEIYKMEKKAEGQLSNWERIGFVEGQETTTKEHSYSFVDKNITTGKYQYRLKQIDYDGSYTLSNIVEIEIKVPLEFSLEQNYPNPFNPTTTIWYSIPESGNVDLRVFNALGSEVMELVNEFKNSGNHSINFDAENLSSGIYFYKLSVNNFSEIKKMILMK
jgi:WD40 repeat protein